MEAAIVTCDHCANKFKIELKERPLAGGGAEQRFRCSHCRTWYTVAMISVEGIRIRQRMRAIELALSERPGDAGLQDELAALRERMRGEVKGGAHE